MGGTHSVRDYLADVALSNIRSSKDSGGSGYEENVWYFCCKDWAKYLLIYDDSVSQWISYYKINIKPNNELCWFEFNGEKYYVDSFSDGTHTLTKQGVPVVCYISTFLNLEITQSGSNYVLNVAED